ncbi:hypothetical protein GCM10010911_72720 [Paenibacillus nasutitermitis]|uniref:F5/8 type C domain-containing protein n=1 Tax=Paenibacillus nasutitermitis TaxID=1652958 RepID=A0A916ZL48_9BACL|nr:DUF5060 domain-containing protein [Paenibacillus nasutitermitis]GGE03083.1 hypothetical protein GCM10010911_72720 [Paenibacillus nasutitermitis]
MMETAYSFTVMKKHVWRFICGLLVIIICLLFIPAGHANASGTKSYTEVPAGLHLVSQGSTVTPYNGMVFNDAAKGSPSGAREHLTDGNLGTLAGGYGAVNFYIDLGRKLPLEYVKVYFSRLWDGVNKVYVSDDAVNWTEVVSGDGSQDEYLRDLTATDSMTQPNDFGALLPAGTTGRYVRLTTRSWANLYEIQVYSTQGNPVNQIQVKGSITNHVVASLSMQLNAWVQPSSATDTSVTWSVYAKPGSTGAAMIDAQTGFLTASSPGIVTVQAAANDGSGITGSLDVTIDASVAKWREMEFALSSAATYSHPFMDVDVTATFTGPNGETLTRPAFWDGGIRGKSDSRRRPREAGR